MALLRNAWVEIFALGLAQCSQTLSIPTIISSLVNYVKTVISQEKVPPVGVKKIVEHVWKLQEFVSEMNRLELDDCEFAYLKLISLFNPGLCILLRLETTRNYNPPFVLLQTM